MENIKKNIKDLFTKNNKILIILGVIILVIIIAVLLSIGKIDKINVNFVDGCRVEDSIIKDGNIFVSVLNNNDYTVDVSYKVEFYDSKTKYIDTKECIINSVFSGSTSYNSLDTSEIGEIGKYKIVAINVSRSAKDNYYKGIESESSEENDIVSIIFKNNTSNDFNAVYFGLMLFDKNNNIVSYSTNEAYDLPANGTVSATAYVPFDENMFKVEFDRYEIVDIKGVIY